MNFNSFFGGGMPGGGGGGRAKPKDIDTEGLYKALGLPKTCTDSDIKKAWRNLAKTHHPDKGGSEEKFKELSKAYEILSDPEKKKTLR